MRHPKQLLISLLGFAVLTANGAFALKERIVYDPVSHKDAPGDDPEFSSVPQSGPSASLLKQLKLQQQQQDAEGALNFLADFAEYQAAKQPQQIDPRSSSAVYSKLAQLQRQQEQFEEAQEEDDQDEQEDQDPDQFAKSYLQSLLGRFNPEEGKQQKMSADFSSSTTTTTQRIQYTKAPNSGALQGSQPQSLIAKNAGGIDFVMIALLTCLAVAAAVGVIVSIFCFVKIQKRTRSTQRYDYSGPGNGTGKKVGGSGSHDSLSGSAASAAASKLSAIFGGASSAMTVDKKLANNATLYHFEHHKKEMMAAESADVPPEFGDSDAESGDENDDNDYTVYECPGLAPTGEMQVDNPLFRIKQQASQPPSTASARVSPPVVVHGLQPAGGSPKQ